MTKSQATALSPQHSRVLRISRSRIDATTKSAGSASAPTNPATVTQQPIFQLNLGNLDNEMDTDLNGAAQQTNANFLFHQYVTRVSLLWYVMYLLNTNRCPRRYCSTSPLGLKWTT